MTKVIPVTGIPGSGKTRLIRELAARLNNDGIAAGFLVAEPGPIWFDSWNLQTTTPGIRDAIDCIETPIMPDLSTATPPEFDVLFLELSGSCYSSVHSSVLPELRNRIHLLKIAPGMLESVQRTMQKGASYVVHPPGVDPGTPVEGASFIQLDPDQPESIDAFASEIKNDLPEESQAPPGDLPGELTGAGMVQLQAKIDASFAYSPTGVITTLISSIQELIERRETEIYHIKASIIDSGDSGPSLEGSLVQRGGAILWNNYRRKLRYNGGELRASFLTGMDPDELEMLIKMIMENVGVENDVDFSDTNTVSIHAKAIFPGEPGL